MLFTKKDIQYKKRFGNIINKKWEKKDQANMNRN